MPKEAKKITVELPAGPAPTFTEQLPSQPGGISAIASANAPFLFFDTVMFQGHQGGVGSLTLTASRIIGFAPEGTSTPLSDHVVVAHVRAGFPALLALRNTIDELLNLAAETAAKQAAAVHAPAPTAH